MTPSDPRLLGAAALQQISDNVHVCTKALLETDHLPFDLGKLALDDSAHLYYAYTALAEENARLRQVAEAARAALPAVQLRSMDGAGTACPACGMFTRNGGQYQHADVCPLRPLDAALAALDAPREGMGAEGEG